MFKGDKVIWSLLVVLAVYSLLAVYSSTSSLAYNRMGGNTTYYLVRHGLILSFGFFIIFITHLIPYRYFSKLSQLFLYISIGLLILTLFLGTSLNEATRWLTLPGLGFTIQPSDFAKLSLVMYLARLLSIKQDKIRSLKEAFQPLILPVIVISLLILPSNLSTAMIIFTTSLILLFIGRVPLKYLMALIGVGFLVLAIFIGGSMLVKKQGRIKTWENRIENYFKGEGEGNFQVDQAKIAIASGGFFGKKPGKSTQRNFLPHPYSDFIFAIIVEEYGLFFGAVPLVLVYLILLFRGGLLVQKANRTFPAFLGVGLTLLVSFQAFINMAVAVNLFPVTGQTLPLVSMGGSSILFTSIAFGIILSVSRGIQTDLENETEPAT